MEPLVGCRLFPQQVPEAVGLIKWKNVSYLGHIHINACIYFCVHTHMHAHTHMILTIYGRTYYRVSANASSLVRVS